MRDAFDREVDLSEEEFRLLRDFLHETFGLYFDDNARSLLRARLLGRLSTLDLRSFEDYYHYLRFGPQRSHELQSMVSHLTNNETYFFREATQLRVFSDNVLRTLRERKTATGERRLRVLSAGCSTGEEALSLAMILLDSGHFFWNWACKSSASTSTAWLWRRRAAASTSAIPSALSMRRWSSGTSSPRAQATA